jgi:hypothetical protein
MRFRQVTLPRRIPDVPSTVRNVSADHGSARLLTWSSDDGRRLETVRIVVTDRGLRASGYLVVAGKRSYGASYSVLCDAEALFVKLNPGQP